MTDTTENGLANIVPAGMWLKTHIRREGNLLKATVYVCVAGSPEVMNFEVDLRPIAKAVVNLHKRLHERAVRQGKADATISGFPGSLIKKIGKGVSSVAKGKLVKAIGSGIKSVVKSKITGAITGGLAVVFPPVGIPAAAAYATANQVINAVDNLKKGKLDLLAQFPMAAGAIANIDAVTGPLAQQVKNAADSALHSVNLDHLPSNIASFLQKNPALKNAIALGTKAKAQVTEMAKLAKSGNKEAQAGVKIFNVALNTKRAIQKPAKLPSLKKVPGEFKAVLIDKHGAIIPGKFSDKSGKKNTGAAIMLRGKRIYKGTFAKIAGEVIGVTPHTFDIDPKMGPDPDSAGLEAYALDPLATVGCCNPESLPSNKR